MGATSLDIAEAATPEDVAWSVEPALAPDGLETENAPRAAATFSLTDHHGFERHLNMAPHVNSGSRVFVSISELGVFGGQVKPFQGAASMEVHNVVPHDNGVVIVRGFIGWERDLNFRLSVFVA
jgi:hypothetical protein